jgi:hypothetical protein
LILIYDGASSDDGKFGESEGKVGKTVDIEEKAVKCLGCLED